MALKALQTCNSMRYQLLSWSVARYSKHMFAVYMQFSVLFSSFGIIVQITQGNIATGCAAWFYATLHVSACGHSTAKHSTAQHSTAQHSTAQHSTAQHSTAQHSTAQHSVQYNHVITHAPIKAARPLTAVTGGVECTGLSKPAPRANLGHWANR